MWENLDNVNHEEQLVLICGEAVDNMRVYFYMEATDKSK